MLRITILVGGGGNKVPSELTAVLAHLLAPIGMVDDMRKYDFTIQNSCIYMIAAIWVLGCAQV